MVSRWSAIALTVAAGLYAQSLNANTTQVSGTSAYTPCIPYLTNCQSDLPGVGQPLPGQWTQSKFRNTYGERAYSLYVPQKGAGQALPLMVMLHGCTQTVEQFARETGMNSVAEKYGFAVLYPEESYQDNSAKCWNWFKPENQVRNGGELGIIIGMVNEVAKTVRLDSQRVYVAGLSAGAAMASSLLACHSDIFSGAGIASGIQFEGAHSDNEAFQAMKVGSSQDVKKTAQDAVKCTGAGARVSTVLVVHGDQDKVVNPINADLIVRQFTAMNDLIDDGQANDSQNANLISSREGRVFNGYAYKFDTLGGHDGAHIGKLVVTGMGHAWSGTVQAGAFADPKGPNASELTWLFLSSGGNLNFSRQ